MVQSPIFNFDFNLFLKKYLKKFIKNRVKILNNIRRVKIPHRAVPHRVCPSTPAPLKKNKVSRGMP